MEILTRVGLFLRARQRTDRPHVCNRDLWTSYPVAEWCSACGRRTLLVPDPKWPLTTEQLAPDALVSLRERCMPAHPDRVKTATLPEGYQFGDAGRFIAVDPELIVMTPQGLRRSTHAMTHDSGLQPFLEADIHAGERH